jgi:acetoacetyl-CoA synthetase
MSCAALGVDAAVVNEVGRLVVDEQGELVVRRPMPSMPTRFWNDPDGSRLLESYFAPLPGFWTQGDWATVTGRKTFLISGRSDATLNRGGVRIGTAELYAVVDELPDVEDSLIVGLDATPTSPDLIVIFVVTSADIEGITKRMRQALRSRLSPRHMPDRVISVPAIPRTSSGKRSELVTKRLIQGLISVDAAQESAHFDQELVDALNRLGYELGYRLFDEVARSERANSGPGIQYKD